MFSGQLRSKCFKINPTPKMRTAMSARPGARDNRRGIDHVFTRGRSSIVFVAIGAGGAMDGAKGLQERSLIASAIKDVVILFFFAPYPVKKALSQRILILRGMP